MNLLLEPGRQSTRMVFVCVGGGSPHTHNQSLIVGVSKSLFPGICPGIKKMFLRNVCVMSIICGWWPELIPQFSLTDVVGCVVCCSYEGCVTYSFAELCLVDYSVPLIGSSLFPAWPILLCVIGREDVYGDWLMPCGGGARSTRLPLPIGWSSSW